MDARNHVPRWKEAAVLEDPEGAVCSKCGGDNDFYDDAGWFYVGKPYRPICEDCWKEGGHRTAER